MTKETALKTFRQNNNGRKFLNSQERLLTWYAYLDTLVVAKSVSGTTVAGWKIIDPWAKDRRRHEQPST